MMRIILASALLLAGALPGSALAKGNSMSMEERDSRVSTAADFMTAHKPAEALLAIDPVISAFDKDKAKTEKGVYCARSLEEGSALRARALIQQQDVDIVTATRCQALFVKGFVLIDLNRASEAGPYLARAAAMAPLNSTFVAEFAEYNKSLGKWTEAYRLFSEASAAVEFSPPDSKDFAQGRAWRGMGFSLIEMNRLDEAEALFKKALALDPNDAHAKNELAYIAEVRARQVLK
jgi:tetratricopeptide (TPR) repeat protein